MCVEAGVNYTVRADFDGLVSAARYDVKPMPGETLEVQLSLVEPHVEP